jgi:drug/metabolite transporter (DMT)-like permease
MKIAILSAIAAAALFGASMPFAKLLAGTMPSLLLAGLLYLGSGLGLLALRLLRDRGWKASGMARGEWRWLSGAILFGGIAGPVALMAGLASTPASTASLMLNLEAVLTAVIAWRVFGENAGLRVLLGMVAIVAGGLVLAWQQETVATSVAVTVSGAVTAVPTHGLLLIALACLCWAIDNNLTRKVSASDAVFIAAMKGLVAGVVNTGLALAQGVQLPATSVIAGTAAVGVLGYGLSLVLFVLALRGLGSARTGAYFSTAPFIGAAVSLAFPGESSSVVFWIAAFLMAFGVWLHLSEHHDHEHTHEALEHEHPHVHDEHHHHGHHEGWDGQEPHVHWHVHGPLKHKHAHYPDVHHRHTH